MMFGIDIESDSILTIAIIYGGIVALVLWFSIIFWAYRDMRARSRDSFAQLLIAIIVAVLNVPGLLIYIFLRPRETLSEAYERSLEEEALLQEIEEKPACPGCGHRVQSDWQACPYCHTRLKKTCISCGELLELSWNLCPHCVSNQRQSNAADIGLVAPQYQRMPTAEQESRVTLTRQQSISYSDPAGDSLEFIDSDEY
jgi:RNA polymerase subunit RPABC4/transcription elongation factor Spt4